MSLRQLTRVWVLLACIQCTYNQAQPQHPSQLDPSKFAGNNNEGDRNDLANQNRPQSGQLQFYMDSSSDCSPTVRETGDRDVMVYGRGATQSGASPLTCELSLRVDQPRDPKRYKISLLDMSIMDCSVRFYIYDGTKSHSMLGSYGCPDQTDTNYNRVVWTSGNQVTFYISRNSREQTQYNIRIQVHAIRADTNWETWPQNPDYNRFEKFEQKWVVLIVGVCYAIITVMALLLLAICFCCIRGDGDKWKTSRFGYINPVMTGNGTKSTLNSSKPWTTSKSNPTNGTTNGQLQRNGSLRKAPVNVKKRMAGGSEDIDSVFESDGTMPNKRFPSKSYASRQQAPPSRGVRQRSGKPVGNYGRDTDESFVQADDDHPQNMFVQREIIIPAKKKHQYRKEDDFTSDDEELSSGGEEIEKVSSAMNTDPEMKDGGVQYSEPEDSEEQEESDGMESDEPEQSVVYSKPQKNTQTQPPRREAQVPVTANTEPHRRPRTPLGDMDQYQYPEKGQRQPDMYQPDFQHQDYRQPEYRQPDYGRPQALPYGYHPSEVPSQPSQHDYYPNMAPPPYQTSGRYPRYTPEPYYPNYEDNQYHPRPGGRPDPRSYPPADNVPRDPPIYSYLVRRGYNPVDERQSPVSSNNSLEHRLGGMEESDASANLDSGVEIMRR